MTAAHGGADPGARPERQWDVALSFAGAQRGYVGQVAEALKARGVSCFYDADEQLELWGRFLAEELPAIYGEQATAVVIFVSAEYAAREWTRVERRTALARAVRERREYVLPARFDDTSLPGLPSDMVTVNLQARTPQHFAAMIADKLAALAAAPADARGPARPARPAGAVRVSEADPRRLGVHAAISVPGVPDDVLPAYVPRDVDAAESGVRARVAAAAERSGLVLLVGGSSVGKTRSAVEAVKTLLPDWWLVHPAGPAEVAALAAAPPLRTVVWLDEFQRYLDGKHGLTGGAVRALLNAPHPAVIIGTMWPNFYAGYTTLPAPDGPDLHAREREVLKLADVVRVDAALSPAEQDRARTAAARDPRLRAALNTAGYGLTQILAAAPQLVARWQDAEFASPYGWAVLTAALDAARLGARAPLSAGFLRAAAPGYLTSQQQAKAPGNWFKQALTYATATLHGTAAALSPAAAGMRQVAGYIAADYLIQHATGGRRYARVPASTWDAIVSHIHDPDDVTRLADSAENRLLYSYAISLYRQAASHRARNSARQLAALLARRGELEEAERILRARINAGDRYAAWQLVELLADYGRLGRAEQILRTRAAAEDSHAADWLAVLLAERGDRYEAEQILYNRALTGPSGYNEGEDVAQRLAWLLSEWGDLDRLRAQADAGNGNAAERLAKRLAERGDLDEAEQILRARADAGNPNAARQLAGLLADYGDLDELRAQADTGNGDAADQLAKRLAEPGDLDEAEQILRARADAGNPNAARQLAELLAERGDLDEAAQILRARGDVGGKKSARQLAERMARSGDELRAQADTGDPQAREWLAKILAQRGDLDGLRARADTGDPQAREWLAKILAQRGDLDGLRARADAGDGPAIPVRLAGLLTKQGRAEEAARLRRFGLNPDGSIACA